MLFDLILSNSSLFFTAPPFFDFHAVSPFPACLRRKTHPSPVVVQTFLLMPLIAEEETHGKSANILRLFRSQNLCSDSS
jgi:hypothetical protein